MKKLCYRKNPVLPAFFILIIVINSCSKNSTTNNRNCDATPKSFSADVNQLIQTYCNQAGCHASGSTNGPGPLTNYTEVFNARTGVRGQVEAGFMPLNTTLTPAQKNTIICWIDSGALNN